jgi:leucine-rich PPR motif-containing protein, mitochondrial
MCSQHLENATPQQCVLMIHCCGNLASEEHSENRTKLVHEIWNTLEKLQIPLDIKHYNALLRVYLENGHSFDSQEFLTTLIQKDIKPNRVSVFHAN